MDYVATRDAGKPAAARGIYGVIEDGGMDLPGPGKPDPAVHLRRILVHSPANAAGEAKRCPETDVMRAYTRPPSPGPHAYGIGPYTSDSLVHITLGIRPRSRPVEK